MCAATPHAPAALEDVPHGRRRSEPAAGLPGAPREWKYLHKPLYVNVGQLDGQGRTAAQVATAHGKDDVAALLQGLSL